MTAFQNTNQLKKAICDYSSSDFFDQFISGHKTKHFDDEKLNFVAETIYGEYEVKLKMDHLIVVGSAKIGFALHNKIKNGEIIKPAFRGFDAESDIDLSICSPTLFRDLWHDLSLYFSKEKYIPIRNNKLGDYLTYGWLRIEQLPKTHRRHLKCDNLRLVTGKIRQERQRGHPKINLGIFHDIEHLKIYQTRSINLCRLSLENPL